MFSLKRPADEMEEGESDEHPLVLQQIEADDLDALLQILLLS
jgi:hypothetical protein